MQWEIGLAGTKASPRPAARLQGKAKTWYGFPLWISNIFLLLHVFFFFLKFSGFLRSIFLGYYTLDFSGLDRETTTYLSLSFYQKTPQKTKTNETQTTNQLKNNLIKILLPPMDQSK